MAPVGIAGEGVGLLPEPQQAEAKEQKQSSNDETDPQPDEAAAPRLAGSVVDARGQQRRGRTRWVCIDQSTLPYTMMILATCATSLRFSRCLAARTVHLNRSS